MKNTTRGFTLIELLVVIAIIGLLSSIVLASLSSARDKAKASKMASDFNQIRTAFTLWRETANSSVWWHEDLVPWTGGVYPACYPSAASANPTLPCLASSTSLGAYYRNPPLPPAGTGNYTFDNDSDTYDPNNGTGTGVGAIDRGVNIVVNSVPQIILDTLDKQIDKGDGALKGKIVWNTTTNQLFYKLGYSPTDLIR